MPLSSRPLFHRRAILGIGVAFMVLLVHLTVYVGLRLSEGARLSDTLPFMVSAPIQYIEDAASPQAQLLAKIQKESLVMAPNTQWVASLNQYHELPPAWLMVTSKNALDHTTSSQAYPKNAGKDCVVQLQVDQHDQGTMVQSIMRLANTPNKAPDALRKRLNEYEALHELGHCLHAQIGYPIDLPGLSSVELHRLSFAFDRNPKSPLASLFREMFADAYATIRLLEQYERSDPVRNDVNLVIAWRALSTQRAMEWRKNWDNGVYLSRGQHATAPMLVALLASDGPSNTLSAAQLATQYASRFVVQSSRHAQDMDKSIGLTFTAQAQVDALLEPVVSAWNFTTPVEQRQRDLSKLLASSDSYYKQALRPQTTWLAQLSQIYPNSEQLARFALTEPSINYALTQAGVNQRNLDAARLAWTKALVFSVNKPSEVAYWPDASIASLVQAMAKSEWTLDDKGSL